MQPERCWLRCCGGGRGLLPGGSCVIGSSMQESGAGRQTGRTWRWGWPAVLHCRAGPVWRRRGEWRQRGPGGQARQAAHLPASPASSVSCNGSAHQLGEASGWVAENEGGVVEMAAPLTLDALERPLAHTTIPLRRAASAAGARSLQGWARRGADTCCLPPRAQKRAAGGCAAIMVHPLMMCNAGAAIRRSKVGRLHLTRRRHKQHLAGSAPRFASLYRAWLRS